MTLIGAVAAGLWIGLLLAPWRPWSTRETLSADITADTRRTRDVTALIPARNEADSVPRTLQALDGQGDLARIVLVDDQSDDGTGKVARATNIERLIVIEGCGPQPGWSGKLWALHQGLEHVESELVLLLDADIELAPGTLAALLSRLDSDDRDLVSIMASLHMGNVLERMLLPPFIYFFKLIYPFALANKPGSRIAAAAGGCVLVRRDYLARIGGFEALHDAIIDDCTLAKLVKRAGGRTWLGLSRDVTAIRPYATLGNIWNMVARSAFTQLRYSTTLLLVCTALLVLSFIAPFVAIGSGAPAATWGVVALLAMTISYLPTVRYYDLHPAWALTLPIAATLYLAMTWTSAWRYWRGERSRWKGRSYDRNGSQISPSAPNPAPDDGN